MGKFPTYEGQNPKHLVEESNKLFSAQEVPVALQSPTVFGNQICCVSFYWLAQKVRESSRNRGKYIDEWAQAYFESDDAHKLQAAYCQVFTWWIAEEAAKTLGCYHYFPGAKDKYSGSAIWGNARNAFKFLEQQGRYTIARNPEVGAFMFRNSKSSSASGHWGIVTEILPNGNYRTIEGNVELENDKEGVGYWEYDKRAPAESGTGIQFVYLHREPSCKNKSIKTYKGWNCDIKPKQPEETATTGKSDDLPPCIDKWPDGYKYNFMQPTPFGNIKVPIPAKNVDGQWYAYKYGAFHPVVNCELKIPKKSDKTEKEGKEQVYSPSQDKANPPEAKQKICRDIIVKVPQKNQLQHWSALKQKEVWADANSAMHSWAGVPQSAINGSALWYNRPDIDPGRRTGFGMFKDKLGNLIYVLNGDEPQSTAIAENGFLGYSFNMDRNAWENNNYNHIVFEVDEAHGWHDGGWKERLNSTIRNNNFFLAGDVYNIRTLGFHSSNVNEFNNNKIRFDRWSGNPVEVNFNNLSDKSLLGILSEVENRGKKLEKPIVIYLTARDRRASFAETMSIGISIMQSVFPIVGFPIPNEALSKAKGLVEVFENDRSGWNMLYSMANAAEYFAPELVKGTEKYIDEIGSDVSEYIGDAAKTVKNYVNSGFKKLVNSDLKEMESYLGLAGDEIGKVIARFDEFQSSATGPLDLTKLNRNGSLSKVNKVVQNMSNMFMLNTVKRKTARGTIQDDIFIANNPLNIPIIQELFIAGGSNAAMRTFPKIEEFTKEFINNPAIGQNYFDPKKYKNGNEMLAAIIGNNFGHSPVDKSILKDLQLDALIEKSKEYENTDYPFVMPDSVDPEYVECYKFAIESASNAKVMWCPEGWDWDHDLRKCVNKTKTQTGYTGGTDVNRGGGGFGIGTGTDVKEREEEKKDDKKSGGGFGIGTDVNRGGGFGINLGNIFKEGNPDNVDIDLGKLPQLPPCITEENGQYYYYPYGRVKQDKVNIVTERPNDKVILVNSGKTGVVNTNNKFPIETSPVDKRNDFIPIEGSPGGNNGINVGQSGFNPNLKPNGTAKVSPLKTITVGNYQPDTNRGEGLANPLPTLNDLPEKIRVYKRNGKWQVYLNGKFYDFDPVNCRIIGFSEPGDEEKEDKKVTKDDCEKEIKALQSKITDLQRQLIDLRSQKSGNENDRKILQLEQQLDQFKRQNQQLETQLQNALKQTDDSEQIEEYVNLVNLWRQRANDYQRQLNIEKSKPDGTDKYVEQINELQNQLNSEQNRRNALLQEIEQLKNREAEIRYIDRNTGGGGSGNGQQTVTKPPAKTVNELECTECTKLQMPKVVESKIIYEHPPQRQCNHCGEYENDCECY